MIYFNASRDQILQLAVNAANASRRVGYGLMHAADITFTKQYFEKGFDDRNEINLDYVYGRMVKLNIVWDREKNCWKMRNYNDVEYQSWLKVYPTSDHLIASVKGIHTIID